MKVITKDFQILQGEHTFEFPVGITVIQGKTGSGKTTLFYAIEDCLVNPSGVDDAINWDAKQASVTIENNNNKVTWIKTQTSSIYKNELTEQEFVKASKLDSSNIADLGFYIKDGDVLNIQGEWNLLFPFALKDTEMFRLFEDIFNISCSFNIIDDYKKEEQGVKSQINQITSQINNITQNVNTIDEILSKVDNTKIDYYINNLNTKKQLVDELTMDFDNLSKNSKYKNIKVPDMYDTSKMINFGNCYNQLIVDYNNYLVNHKRLDIVLPDAQEFNFPDNTIAADYQIYCNNKQLLENYNKQLQTLTSEYKETEQKLKSIKVCPTCGRPLEE